MRKQTYYGLDIAKFISAFLVIAIHTAPLIQISEDANFVLVQIIARIAVPFFFVTSGFLFFKKIDIDREWNDYENLERLRHYIFRILKIYGVWSILYLPFNYLLYAQDGFGITTCIRYIRDFLFTGSYYHLWFLPALVFAIFIVYLLVTRFSYKVAIRISFVLYLLGMVGNIYGNIITQIPVISNLYQIYMNIFTTTRNGLFFGMIFVSIGAYFAMKPMLSTNHYRYIGFGISFLLLIGEAFLLRHFHFMNDLVSMYIMLVPCMIFLFEILISLSLSKREIFIFLRRSSLIIYVSHIMFVVILFQFIPGLGNLLIYLISACSSFILSIAVYALSKKVAIIKCLY